MFDLWKGKTSWLVVLLITFITPIGFAGLFGDDIIFIKKTGVSGLDTNAETACGDNEYLRGDGTCQTVATEGITDTNIYTAGILNPDTNAVMTDWNMNDNNIIKVNYLKNGNTNINLTNTDIIINTDLLTINSAIANNGVYQSNLIPDSGDYNLGNTTNKWNNGYFDDNVNATNFVGNLDGNVKAMDVNTNALNVIAPTDISATTPLIHIENDTGGNIYDLFKLDVNKNGFRLYHGTRPTHMAGMDVTSDPKNMASSATYIHGPANGRIYFDCLTKAGASGTCYSMEFTNIANFVDLPPRMLQNTSTTDTSMCATGVACSSIGGTGTVDLAHVYQAVGYMSARGNQTTGQPAVKWKSFASNASSYNSQAYYSTYSYDTNATAPYLTTLSHTKWLTAGVTKMTLTPDGNLSTAADINTATRFIAKNQIGIDKNMTVTQGAGTCDLNFIGGILIASTC